MARTLLLCFIHGFKGSDDTFQTFPADLQKQVLEKLPDQHVQSVVYPKYETRGELGQATELFLSWLKERVMEVRKARSSTPWPPKDRDVGVVLVAHSMGGFVAADALLLVLDEKRAHDKENAPLFPLIQGILAFDTPYNGLARSMFVYGAFSNYNKVSSVFNVMTALAAAPSALGRKALMRGVAGLPTRAQGPNSVAWQGWQLVAVRTGTVGAIAAGGVAAYMHRREILAGVRSMRNLNRESVKEGYQSGVDALGQGLAYINRGNVGKSFEYLSDHFTFVGSLMKQQELGRRLERLGALRGVGVHDFYTSLGENGVWSGGYFVPERTFCAVPGKEHGAFSLFSRCVIEGDVGDEVQAHMSMFKRDRNKGYDGMTTEAADLVISWFNDDADVFDDPKFATPPPPEPLAQPTETTEDGKEVPKTDELSKMEVFKTDEVVRADDVPMTDAAPTTDEGPKTDDRSTEKEATEEKADEEPAERGEGDALPDDNAEDLPDNLSNDLADDLSLPDESPLDIAAAAELVPLPDDDDEAPDTLSATTTSTDKDARKSTYMRHLFSVAHQAGAGVKAYVPSVPKQMPSGLNLKSFVPTQMPNMPSVNPFARKKKQQQTDGVSDEEQSAKGSESGVEKDCGKEEEEVAKESEGKGIEEVKGSEESRHSKG